MKRRIVAVCVSLLFPIILSTPALAATPDSQPLRPSSHPGFMLGGHEHNPLTNSSAVTTQNWSGYAVTGTNGTYNSVSSAWVQSALTCASISKPSYSSYWVGLDGFSNQTVEQIGTEANCSHGIATYGAWYEMYPSNPYEVSVRLSIHAGDHMSASVTYTPAITMTVGHRVITTKPATYVLSLTNVTSGGKFSIPLQPHQTYARSSAEVITEAPYSNGVLPLANYGTVNYAGSLVNGQPMGSFSSLQNIVMQNPAGMVSTPSTFDPTNQSFSVTWYNN